MGTPLDRSMTVEGHWFLPDAPADRHYGVLHFDGVTGPTLDLRGHFSSELPLTMDAPFRPLIVLGETDDGKGCSLIDAAQVGHTTRAVGKEQRTLTAELALIGQIHAGADGKLPIEEVRVQVRHLPEWLDIHPFRWWFDDIPGKSVASARFEKPQPLDLRIDGAVLRLETLLGSASHDERSLEWRASTRLSYRPERPEDLRVVLARLAIVRDFLSLHFGSAALFLEAEMIPHLEDGEDPDNPTPAIILFQQDLGPPRRRVASYNVLIPLKAFRRSIGEALADWFEIHARVGPATDLLLDSFGHTGRPVNKLLTVSRAFEMLHRGLVGGEYLPAGDYQKVYETLTEAIPGDVPRGLRDRLKGSLKYGNEISLRTRLRRALESLTDQNRDLLFPEGVKKFAGTVADTRNYFTHLSEELRPRALHGPAVAVAADRLQMLAWFLLMRELGHSEPVLVEAVKRDPVWAQRTAYAHGHKESPNAQLAAVLLAAKSPRADDGSPSSSDEEEE